jgi:hypothetical protein
MVEVELAGFDIPKVGETVVELVGFEMAVHKTN